MTPTEAAFHFLHLEATASVAESIAFAHSYEDGASSEDYAAYLNILETKLTGVDLDAAPCESCGGKGYTMHRVEVYEHGRGVPRFYVDERPCERCAKAARAA